MLLIGESFNFTTGSPQGPANTVCYGPVLCEGSAPNRLFALVCKNNGPGTLTLRAQESPNGATGWAWCVSPGGGTASLTLVPGAESGAGFIVRGLNNWFQLVSVNTAAGNQCNVEGKFVAIKRAPVNV